MEERREDEYLMKRRGTELRGKTGEEGGSVLVERLGNETMGQVQDLESHEVEKQELSPEPQNSERRPYFRLASRQPGKCGEKRKKDCLSNPERWNQKAAVEQKLQNGGARKMEPSLEGSWLSCPCPNR